MSAAFGVLLVLGTAAPAAAAERAADLEPYLKSDFAGLAAQVQSDATPDVIKRRAMHRLAARFPDRAPEALLPVLDKAAAHLDESAGELLFVLGRPHSRTAELVQRIGRGRTVASREQVVAMAEAVSWPGNGAALPVLRRMIAERWDTAPEAKLFMARILDLGPPDRLLRLPAYEGAESGTGMDYARRVAALLRAQRDPRANEVLLKDGRARKAQSQWDGVGTYALAWPGNTALAEAYLKEPASTRLLVAAARTRDERCLARIRDEFEGRAAAFVAARDRQRPLPTFTWILTAGMESADEKTAPTIAKLVATIEEMRTTAERAPASKQRNLDPGGSLRDTLLRGLCLRPSPQAAQILAPYLKDSRYASLVGLALLRAGDPEGLDSLLTAWKSAPGDDALAEAFLVYTGNNILPPGGRACGPDCVEKARGWCARNGRGATLRQRIGLVNKTALSDDLVAPLAQWP